MALAVNDILEITDVQVHLGQAVYNIYYYEVQSVEALADYDDVQGAFKLQIQDAVREIQVDTIEHTRILVRNLTNGIDLHEEPYSLFGNHTADSEASFYALGFRLVRSTLLTRHGSKRIGGIAEDMVLGNTVVAGELPDVVALADAMAEPLEVTGTVDHDFSAIPVIVGRFPTGDPNEGEIDLSRINPVAAGQFIRVTTQNSRKAGRGI